MALISKKASTAADLASSADNLLKDLRTLFPACLE